MSRKTTKESNNEGVEFPLFPLVIPTHMERQIPATDNIERVNDTDLTIHTCGDDIFVHQCDAGFHLMPRWIERENIAAAFELTDVSFNDGYKAGNRSGRREERRKVAFYANVLNGRIEN